MFSKQKTKGYEKITMFDAKCRMSIYLFQH